MPTLHCAGNVSSCYTLCIYGGLWGRQAPEGEDELRHDSEAKHFWADRHFVQGAVLIDGAVLRYADEAEPHDEFVEAGTVSMRLLDADDVVVDDEREASLLARRMRLLRVRLVLRWHNQLLDTLYRLALLDQELLLAARIKVLRIL